MGQHLMKREVGSTFLKVAANTFLMLDTCDKVHIICPPECNSESVVMVCNEYKNDCSKTYTGNVNTHRLPSNDLGVE
jgi:hypothetical protein